MSYIKKISIQGFKKFEKLDFDLNSEMNILVGENEAGKSTILSAIRLVLCQDYKNADKVCLFDLFNKEQVARFNESRTIAALPKIHIELEFVLDPQGANAENFFGENHQLGKDRLSGIAFDCSFDEEMGAGLEADIANGVLPVEYYSLKWTTFAGHAYVASRKPFGFLPIDTSDARGDVAFNFFSRTLFANAYEPGVRLKAKNDFRTALRRSFEDLKLSPLDGGRSFAINDKKVGLETVLSVAEGGILLENKGKGVENLVKTRVALQRERSAVEVVTVEEPENHLSYVNMRKMIDEIRNRPKGCQVIIATHSNMIANSLGLTNVLWVSEGKDVVRLSKLDKNVEKFFVKADTHRMLDFILAKKVLLVEGPTEYMLMPRFIEEVSKKTVEELGISVIACDGVSYKNFLAIDVDEEKKIAVLTDNDGDEDRIRDAVAYNNAHKNSRIFTAADVEDWTWEVCFYKANKAMLDTQFPPKAGASYVFNKTPYPNTLGRMLTNKADVAYSMLNDKDKKYVLPQYVHDAIKWLEES